MARIGTDLGVLRTVEGRRWLRGYRCSSDYVVPPDSVHVFMRI